MRGAGLAVCGCFDAVPEVLGCGVQGADWCAEDGDGVGGEREVSVYLQAEFEGEGEEAGGGLGRYGGGGRWWDGGACTCA